MENTYKIEIISPEKVLLSDDKVEETVLPSYEGEMGIMRDHTSVILFLKPGIIKILKSSENKDSFFVEDGIVEFSNNSLTVLSSKIINIKSLRKEKINQIISETKNILKDEKLDDNDRYLANQKIDILQILNLN